MNAKLNAQMTAHNAYELKAAKNELDNAIEKADEARRNYNLRKSAILARILFRAEEKHRLFITRASYGDCANDKALAQHLADEVNVLKYCANLLTRGSK